MELKKGNNAYSSSQQIKSDSELTDTSRRNFLKTSLYGGAASTGILSAQTLLMNQAHADSTATYSSDRYRNYQSLSNRFNAMVGHWQTASQLPDQELNGDEARYAEQNYYASYTKALPHNAFGEVEPAAFQQLVSAMQTGSSQDDFNRIPLSAIAQRGLVNPEAANMFTIEALDSHATRIKAAPVFRSTETAAEMGELYWKALLRDLPYRHYESAIEVNNATTDLNRFSDFSGPKINGQVTAQTLFRGDTQGDLTGPYISQLLWKSVPWGPTTIEQHYKTPLSGVNFMTDEANWLNIQQGALPLESLSFESQPRYIYNHRSLGEYVHSDLPYQAYVQAALILLSYGRDILDEGNPYRSEVTNRVPFTSFGVAYIMDLVSRAANLGLAAAWFQKWSVHRCLRPEMFAGRVHFHLKNQRQYEINQEILDSDAISRVYSQYGTFFLPQAFTEGSPTHPSYPAGHACVAGACSTVLKALFNEDFVIPDPVEANDTGTALDQYFGPQLTVGGEIDKLANNICIGRNAAGVHYRQDGTEGLIAGEQMAISLLQDHSRLIDFDGFYLKQFDGRSIRIHRGNVIQI